MSELRPGAGQEPRPPVQQVFVDYVSDHARQGVYAQRPPGPSQGGQYLYDVDLSGIRQQIIESPFDQVFFEDDQRENHGVHSGVIQKDQVSFWLGGVRLMAVYYEDGPEPGYGGSRFMLWSRGGRIDDPDGAIAGLVIEQLTELENAGRIVPATNPYRQPRRVIQES